MEKSDYTEPLCPFDTTEYTGLPDTSRAGQTISVPEIIRRYDALVSRGDNARALEVLEQAHEQACAYGDWRGQLSMASEMLGISRKLMDRERGIAAVNEAEAIIREHHLGRTVSGATVLLNAATTLKCFEESGEAVKIFTHVSRVFGENLDPGDYRFAGLYNNMALALADTGEREQAEACFHRALACLEKSPATENDRAVTWCNLADLYQAEDCTDPRIEECLENAWQLLNAPETARDGYHAFTASKCAEAFEFHGMFRWAEEVRARAKEIYERA